MANIMSEIEVNATTGRLAAAGMTHLLMPDLSLQELVCEYMLEVVEECANELILLQGGGKADLDRLLGAEHASSLGATAAYVRGSILYPKCLKRTPSYLPPTKTARGTRRRPKLPRSNGGPSRRGTRAMKGSRHLRLVS